MVDPATLFPDGDFRFHLTMQRGDIGAFFRLHDPTGGLLKERRRWLDVDQGAYAALERSATPLLEDLRAISREWGLPDVSDVGAIGRCWEPDVLLLSREPDDRFRLRGGALVFPSGWALTEKLGRTMEEIHGIVPGLNDAIGPAIDRFLSRLGPGAPVFRFNWGLTASDEWNAHPSRRLPAPRPPVRLDRLWLRIEHQALAALPRTGGVVFGIRISLHRLDQTMLIPEFSGRLSRALKTMPPAVAGYKRINGILADLTAALDADDRAIKM